MMRLLTMMAAGVLLAACAAPTTEDVAPKLKTLTASTLPGTDPARIEVSDAKQSAAKWEWRARLDGRSFQCDSDNRFRLPSCVAVENQEN
jgi:uncharacterized lipoprotein YajG